MRAIIKDNRWIWFDNITTHEDNVLWDEFSVSRPGYGYVDPSQRANLWDGIYRKYNRGQKRMARPLLAMLRGICQKHGLPLDVVDERPPAKYRPIDPATINADFLPGITLDKHQIDWGKLVCKTECAICDTPTGGGKGEMIAITCKVIECPTVILADQRIVIEQLKRRLELRDIQDDIGVFYAGQRPSGQMVVVGSIQSLSAPSKMPQEPQRSDKDTAATWKRKQQRWEQSLAAWKTRRKNAKLLQEYVRKAHMLIVDECDKAVSDPWKNVFRHQFAGRRRYGFSATPFDAKKPVEGLTLQEHLGSVQLRVSRKELVRIGRIIETEYIAFVVDGNIHDGTAFDIAFDEWVVRNQRLHTLYANLCYKYRDLGNLILVDRVELGETLVAAMAKVGLESHFIHGATPKRRRNELLAAFERREFNVLIGGKIINRGLDLKGGCDNLLLATSSKLSSDLLQKVGRALRLTARGKSRVFDSFFRCNKYLYDHSKERLKVMVGQEYKTTIVLPNGTVDGEKLIKSRFRFPTKLCAGRTGS